MALYYSVTVYGQYGAINRSKIMATRKAKILKFKRKPYVEMLVRDMGGDHLELIGIEASGKETVVEKLLKDDMKIGGWFQYRAGGNI